jgi:hypothetical protein
LANSIEVQRTFLFQRAGDRITSSGASSEPSEESPIGDEVATAFADDDDDEEDRNIRSRGWSVPREEPEACPIEPVCQGSISYPESV